ncbi:MAG: copper-binding protein [Polaromonas sp.]|uniref:copper-binding protein n=1 Tax=Polaromonas sp. TaxID=1869339 RepID=UPI0025DB4FD4|nr:copper-binding protein [Polaromonas sp.]MBI2728477.1 copper-binding protein [Polaromonas sp.]
MKSTLKLSFATFVVSIGMSGIALAAPDNVSSMTVATASTTGVQLTSGEIRKVDLEQGKLTIKHEALENLDMPGMTMVFKASDAKLLNGVKQGDKILFRAEKTDAGFMIVRLEQAK